MPMLNQVNKLFARSKYSFEHTSYLNSYCRSLSHWSHYQARQSESAVALGSMPFSSAPRAPQPAKSRLTAIGNFPARSHRRSALRLWNRCVSAIGSFFSRAEKISQFAEDSAQSCLVGLSRFAVTGESRLELTSHEDRSIVRLININRPLLVSAERAA